MDLRERVVAAVETDGMSRHEAAARFGIAVSSAIKWVARYRKTGSVAPSKIGGYKPKALRGAHASWLMARCQEKDFTISQFVEELQSVRGLKVDRRSVWEFLHAERLSHKKKTATAQEQDRKDVKRRREQWRKYQGRIDPKRLVFIDERGPRPTWRRFGMGTARKPGQRKSPVRPLEDHDIHRSASAGWDCCAMPLRGLPGLGAPEPGSNAQTGRDRHHGQSR